MRVAGIDEVGRGALFGPVVTAAVVLSATQVEQLAQAGVRDSKLLTPRSRQQLANQIRAIALDYTIGLASVQEIDRLNILQATLLAMKRAILKLSPLPEHCLIDGNQPIPDLGISQQAIIQGDRYFIPIAAASIVAKVWRDELIVRLASRYPEYDLAQNKGYGTKKHRQALLDHGPSRQHRLSFSPCRL
ncbi:MAG: ribonuclease HII [Microcoleaceae cyanobacterium]